MDLGGGFWAAIIPWTLIALSCAGLGYFLHMREKNRTK